MRPTEIPMRPKTMRLALGVTAGLAVGVLPVAAYGYVGPGAGLTAIGTMLALFAVVILAVVGFVWYPVKRLMRSKKAHAKVPEGHETEE